MEFTIIIPARYDSVRFPGKVLADFKGKPLIQHVFENATQSGATRVIIATDDDRIKDVAESFGAELCMTSADHESGTDRLAEVVTALDLDDDEIVVNLQADEPQLTADWIRAAVEDLIEFETAKVSTLSVPITDAEDLNNPNIVKIVTNKRGVPMLFSRAPIPWGRDTNGQMQEKAIEAGLYQRHIGLYVYRCSFLHEYLQWSPSPLEELERLEQLRILWYGRRMHVKMLDKIAPHGVDTPEDLERL